MNKSVIAILGIVVVLGIGLYLWSTGAFTQAPSGPGTADESVKVSEPEETNSVIVVLREQNDSGESGTAILSEVDGKVRIVLNLTGAPEDVSQPAHIHVNNCADIAGVQYPLASPVNGSSETMLEVSMEELQAGLPFSVNVHKSPEEASVYVACGDIVLL